MDFCDAVNYHKKFGGLSEDIRLTSLQLSFRGGKFRYIDSVDGECVDMHREYSDTADLPKIAREQTQVQTSG